SRPAPGQGPRPASHRTRGRLIRRPLAPDRLDEVSSVVERLRSFSPGLLALDLAERTPHGQTTHVVWCRGPSACRNLRAWTPRMHGLQERATRRTLFLGGSS